MSVRRSIESAVSTRLEAAALDRVVAPGRAIQVVEYLLVGATGVGVDVGTVALSTGPLGWELATVLAFAIATTWNFVWNYQLTFDRPDGSVRRQYLWFWATRGVSLAVRFAVVAVLITHLDAPVLVATVVGILAAAAAGYLGAEQLAFKTESDT